MPELSVNVGALGNYGLDSLYALDQTAGTGEFSEFFTAWTFRQRLRKIYDGSFLPILVDEMVQEDERAQKERDGYLRQHIRRYGKKLLPEELALVLRTKYALEPRLQAWQEGGTLESKSGSLPLPDGRMEEQPRMAVTVKIVRPRGAQKTETARRLVREWKNQARVMHPHLLAILDAGLGALRLKPLAGSAADRYEESCPYLVLERLANSLTPAEVCKLPGLHHVAAIIQLAGAVRAIHGQDLLHGGIQPENVALTRRGDGVVAKLGDFGILRADDAATLLQRTGALELPNYLSPEDAIDAEEVGPPSDLYALTATLYYYSFGCRPYQECGADGREILRRKLAGEMPAFPPGHHDFLISILKRGMAPDPACRYPSTRELVRDLELYRRILHHESVAIQEQSETIDIDRNKLSPPQPFPDGLRPAAWRGSGMVSGRPAGQGSSSTGMPEIVRPVPRSDRPDLPILPNLPDLPPLPAAVPKARTVSTGPSGSVSVAPSTGRDSVRVRRMTGAHRQHTGELRTAGATAAAADPKQAGGSSRPGGLNRPPATGLQTPAEKRRRQMQMIGVVALLATFGLGAIILFNLSMEPPRAQQQIAGRSGDSPDSRPPKESPGGSAPPSGNPSLPGPGIARPATGPVDGPDSENPPVSASSRESSPLVTPLVATTAPSIPSVSPMASGVSDGSTPGGSAKRDYARFVIVPMTGKHSAKTCVTSFSPDGSKLLTAGEDRRACLWPLPAAGFACDLRSHTQAVNWAAFSPDGRTILTAGAEGNAYRFDREGHALGKGPVLTAPVAIQAVAFSRDGSLAFLGDRGGMGHLFNTVDWKERTTILQAVGPIARACFTADGRQLVTSASQCADQAVEVWDVAKGARVKVLGEHRSWVSGLTLSPDGATLLSADWQGNRIVLFNTADWSKRAAIADPGGQPMYAVYTPDGRGIVSGGRDTLVKVWDAKTLELLATYKGASDYAAFCRFVDVAPNGQYIAAGYDDGSFRVWQDSSIPAKKSPEVSIAP